MCSPAVGNNHAVLGLPGVHGSVQFVVSRHRGSVWLCGRIIGGLLGWDVWRALIAKYGRYVLISSHDLDLADRWFARFGEIIVFASRLLPVIRTFIAFPAGVARMDLKKFVIYTFAGSLPWCVGLAYVGQRLGKEWDTNPTLKTLFHRFDFVIGIVIVLVAVWWIWRHIKHVRRDSQQGQ